ncbi:hypothetical protein [Parasphingorhabdus sp.]|uniref:hypothetical protein n=1 Tax=Parasphingorhabdus sp. TaxID=2709688 RepID=UPI003593169B
MRRLIPGKREMTALRKEGEVHLVKQPFLLSHNSGQPPAFFVCIHEEISFYGLIHLPSSTDYWNFSTCRLGQMSERAHFIGLSEQLLLIGMMLNPSARFVDRQLLIGDTAALFNRQVLKTPQTEK